MECELSIIEGKSKIDIAFIAAPYVNKQGDAVGYLGKNKCGSLGYAIPDSIHAKIKVLVTDNLVDEDIQSPEISGSNIDYILLIDQIGPIKLLDDQAYGRVPDGGVYCMNLFRATPRLSNILGIRREP